MTVALLVARLRAEIELTIPELERFAELNAGTQPDVMVCACDLAPEDCAILRRLARRMPYMQYVIVSSIRSPGAVRRALDLGARGLVDERHLEQTLGAAVRAVSVGLLALTPEARWSVEKPIFTHREKETLALVVDGFTNSQIAIRLGLSESTVKSHLASVFAKLGVHSRSEAATRVLDPDSGLASIALPPRRPHAPLPAVRRGW